jgi:hypothetical protein
MLSTLEADQSLQITSDSLGMQEKQSKVENKVNLMFRKQPKAVTDRTQRPSKKTDKARTSRHQWHQKHIKKRRSSHL